MGPQQYHLFSFHGTCHHEYLRPSFLLGSHNNKKNPQREGKLALRLVVGKEVLIDIHLMLITYLKNITKTLFYKRVQCHGWKLISLGPQQCFGIAMSLL